MNEINSNQREKWCETKMYYLQFINMKSVNLESLEKV